MLYAKDQIVISIDLDGIMDECPGLKACAYCIATPLRLLPIPVGLLVLPCTRQCRRPRLTSSPLFFLYRTEEPTKAGTCARDRRTI